MSQDANTIARTILAQIGSNSMMCMGVPRNSIWAIPSNATTEGVKDEDRHEGGLRFKFTNCPKVRNGEILIVLKGNDTYTVQIFNVRGREIYKASDIYCDMLGGPNGVLEGVTG